MKKIILYISVILLVAQLHAAPKQDTTLVKNKVFNPSTFELKQNYPNPFGRSTQIEFYSQADQSLTLRVYDMLGNILFTKVIETEKGANYYTFDRGNLPQGFYLYSLQSGNIALTKRMMIRD